MAILKKKKTVEQNEVKEEKIVKEVKEKKPVVKKEVAPEVKEEKVEVKEEVKPIVVEVKPSDLKVYVGNKIADENISFGKMPNSNADAVIYDGNLDFSGQGISELPVKFDIVKGSVDISNNKFNTLGNNFPAIIKGDLAIKGNPNTANLMNELINRRIRVTGKIIWI